MSVANRPVHRPLSPASADLQAATHLDAVHPASRDRHRTGGRGALSRALGDLRGGQSRGLRTFQSFNTSILGRIVLGGWLFCGLLSPVQRHPAPVLGCGLRLRAQGRLSQRLDRRRRLADRHGACRGSSASGWSEEAADGQRSQNASRPRPRPRFGQGRRASLVGAAAHRHRADPARRVVRHLAGHAERRRLRASCAPGSARRSSWCC